MNNLVVGGNLTRDCEIKQTSSGTSVLNGSIALNRSIPDGNGGRKKETAFLDFTMWGNRAEAFMKFHSKGSYALLTGRLSMNKWSDKHTGAARTKLFMTADEWEFAGGGSRGDSAPTSGESVFAPESQDDTPF